MKPPKDLSAATHRSGCLDRSEIERHRHKGLKLDCVSACLRGGLLEGVALQVHAYQSTNIL